MGGPQRTPLGVLRVKWEVHFSTAVMLRCVTCLVVAADVLIKLLVD